mgnify:CR=1 FL=1
MEVRLRRFWTSPSADSGSAPRAPASARRRTAGSPGSRRAACPACSSRSSDLRPQAVIDVAAPVPRSPPRRLRLARGATTALPRAGFAAAFFRARQSATCAQLPRSQRLAMSCVPVAPARSWPTLLGSSEPAPLADPGGTRLGVRRALHQRRHPRRLPRRCARSRRSTGRDPPLQYISPASGVKGSGTLQGSCDIQCGIDAVIGHAVRRRRRCRTPVSLLELRRGSSASSPCAMLGMSGIASA